MDVSSDGGGLSRAAPITSSAEATQEMLTSSASPSLGGGRGDMQAVGNNSSMATATATSVSASVDRHAVGNAGANLKNDVLSASVGNAASSVGEASSSPFHLFAPQLVAAGQDNKDAWLRTEIQNLDESYQKMSSKKIRSSLTSFLSSVEATIDTSSTTDDSLRSLVEHPPIGGRQLEPLSKPALLGFRLRPGPVPDAYRMSPEGSRKKQKKKKHKHGRHDYSKNLEEASLNSVGTAASAIPSTSAGRSSDGSAPGTPGTPATMATATSISASNVQLSDGGVGASAALEVKFHKSKKRKHNSSDKEKEKEGDKDKDKRKKKKRRKEKEKEKVSS